ncbi:nucleoside-diphosphate sugar epimerase [Candidatus Symbiobacter mobilis]|uniref:Nucleoside-diphosphate-sugar epimerase n=1 Tax=Candidatus Symbiobacter mobilis CR TaxID=946483 RepID=U5N535_9BURK|nr:nucleoside-diphosphate sugar epimerase [Candidatus Symbiobacter mobilis]AGX86636.1 nucleoside-diphosphate-sugar epimerase [Candidatus Symbiobacter mobilis CR]
MDYIAALEKSLGKKAVIKMLPLQPGDVLDTFADVSDLVEQFQYKPTTLVEQGIEHFVAWYREYYKT